MIRPRLNAGLFRGVALLPLLFFMASSLGAQAPPASLFAWDEVLTGDDESKLQWPTEVASGGVDEIVVADAAGPALWVFRDSGGAEGWGVEKIVPLAAPAFDLACGADRYLISARQPGKLQALSRPGHTLRDLVLPSEIVPGAVACANDERMLVHDLATGRVVVLDAGLEVLASIPVEGSVSALSPASGGGFYATLTGTGEVRRYAANGELVSSVAVPGLDPAPAWPVGLIVESNGEMVVADRHGGRLLVLATGGRWVGSGSRRGWEPGLLRYPADVARLSDGSVVVADEGNGRVQIFRWIDKKERP